MTADETILR